MENRDTVALKGHVLIAMPGLADPNFSHTITCICEHNASGAVGIIANRPHPLLTAKEIFEELKIRYIPEFENTPIHIGGPVHMSELFILHGPPFDWEGCMNITKAIGMSTTRDILEAIAAGNGPDHFIVALGCAGWGENQLESEIAGNVWLTCPLSDHLIFETPIDRKWETAMQIVGIDPALLSDTAGRA